MENVKPKRRSPFQFFVDDWKNIIGDIKRNKIVYLMMLPVLVYFILFEYGPMSGIIIAFKDFKPFKGIWASNWIGFEHFQTFFSSYLFWDLLKNTFSISLTSIIFGFPAPIILALLLNEVRSDKFKRTVQTITYMPHFISAVVIAGIIIDMLASDGVIVIFLSMVFGMEPTNLLYIGDLFTTIFVASDIWQNIGWGTIIYLSALAAIDPSLYEAASIDGASRLKQVFAVTLPGIAPTIVTLFILRIGRIMTVGWEKIVLLSNPAISDSANVISSFVYLNGMEQGNFSYSAAVGLFNSIINFTLLFMANKVSKKLNETSLW